MTYPAIPKNPVTLFVNGWLTDNALKALFNRYIPAWTYKITSGFRDAEDQERLKKQGLKPASKSAHLYNLARDFVLVNQETGKIATDSQMKKIYNQYIKPNWEGYSYFSPKNSASNTGWIHLNIDRKITEMTMLLGLAATAFGVGMSVKTILHKLKQMKGR